MIFEIYILDFEVGEQLIETPHMVSWYSANQGCQILQTKMGTIYQNDHKNDNKNTKRKSKLSRNTQTF
jgi:hypothetical protein